MASTGSFSCSATVTSSAGAAGISSPSSNGDSQSIDGSPAVTVNGYVTGTIAFGASVSVNLFDGSVLALDGVTAVPFRTINYIDVWLSTAGAGGYLRVGGAGSNAAVLWFGSTTDTEDVVIGGPPFMQGGTVGYVIDNTHKLLKIANPHGSLAATYTMRASGLLV